MATWQVQVKRPDGSYRVGEWDAETPAAAMEAARQAGMEPRSYNPTPRAAKTVTATPTDVAPPATVAGQRPVEPQWQGQQATTGGGLLSRLGQEVAPTAAQIGTGMGLAAAGITAPYLTIPAEIAAPLLTRRLVEGRPSTTGERLGDIAGALLPRSKQVYQAGKTAVELAERGLSKLGLGTAERTAVPAIETAAGRAATRLGLDLPAQRLGEMEGTRVGKAAEAGVTRGMEERELAHVTEAVPRAVESRIGLAGEPLHAGRVVRTRFQNLLEQFKNRAPMLQDTAVRQAEVQTGVKVTGKATDLMKRIRTNPLSVAQAAGIMGKYLPGRASTEGVVQSVRQAFFTDLFDRTIKLPGKGEPAAGIVRGAYLDVGAVRDALGKLGQGDRHFLGPIVNEIDLALSKATGATRAASRLSAGGEAAAAKDVKVPLDIFSQAFALYRHGVTASGATGILTYALGGSARESAAAGIGAAVLGQAAKGGKKATQFLLARFMESEAGQRWVATGVKAAAHGIPQHELVPQLARTLPHVFAATFGGDIPQPAAGALPQPTPPILPQPQPPPAAPPPLPPPDTAQRETNQAAAAP